MGTYTKVQYIEHRIVLLLVMRFNVVWIVRANWTKKKHSRFVSFELKLNQQIEINYLTSNKNARNIR